jgi:DoxX-like family
MPTNIDAFARWLGRLLSALVVIVLTAEAAVELFAPAAMEQEMAATGFAQHMVGQLGLITLFCAIVYAIPKTAFLGAILITAFLGGAITAHFRVGDIGSPPQLVSLVLGFATWGGLWLRDKRLRPLFDMRFDKEQGGTR